MKLNKLKLALGLVLAVPAIAIAGAPIELVRHPSLQLVLILAGISFFWTFLAFFLLKKAIIKYDSGNLVGYKVNS